MDGVANDGSALTCASVPSGTWDLLTTLDNLAWLGVGASGPCYCPVGFSDVVATLCNTGGYAAAAPHIRLRTPENSHSQYATYAQ